jgi:hypothetical protein
MLVTIAVSWAVLAAGGAWFYRSQEERVRQADSNGVSVTEKALQL